MRRSFACRRWLVCVLLFSSALGTAQEAGLKARVELTRNGARFKDASQAVIWLVPLGGAAIDVPKQQPSEIPKLTQKNKSFHPSLVVIPVGGRVEFPNDDPFFHNVFSLFEGKRFDLGLYESGSTRVVQFDKPGISFIFCNIHPEMSAVVIALSTPYYAISNARGEVSFPNVPPGRYELQIFHSSVAPDALRALRREITVSRGDTSIGTFSLAESNLEIHKNKYGHDYDRPVPDNPAYVKP
jgi:plastocyanin